MPRPERDTPLLLQLLNAFNEGGSGHSKEFGIGGMKSAAAASYQHDSMKRVEAPASMSVADSLKSKPAPSKQAPSHTTDQNLAKANNLLAELDREEKSGFNLRESQDDDFDMGMSGKKKGDDKKAGGLAGLNLNGGISKDKSSENIGDGYDDDFEDDIPEDLPEQVDPMLEDADLNARSANNVAGSG